MPPRCDSFGPPWVQGHPRRNAKQRARGHELGHLQVQRPEVHDHTPIIVAVAAPVAMKVSVAVKDRVENRVKPQTPCPLVQPLPKRVP